MVARGEDKCLRGKHICGGDFSKSKNNLNRDGLTAAPVEKGKQHGCKPKWGFAARQIKR